MSIYKPVRNGLTRCVKKVLTEIGYEDTVVIPSHQNGLEPTQTYCVINTLGIRQEGGRNEASFIEKTSDILESMTHYRVMTQITFLGQDSEMLGMDFRHAIVNNRRCFEYFQFDGFGILSRGELRRIPQKRETEWTPLVNMDMDFSFAVFTRQSYDWVEYITVNGEVIRIWNDE